MYHYTYNDECGLLIQVQDLYGSNNFVLNVLLTVVT